MPWTVERPAAAMRHLPWPVREKAVEVANALRERGRDEALAIRIAIAVGWRWARRRGLA